MKKGPFVEEREGHPGTPPHHRHSGQQAQPLPLSWSWWWFQFSREHLLIALSWARPEPGRHHQEPWGGWEKGKQPRRTSVRTPGVCLHEASLFCCNGGPHSTGLSGGALPSHPTQVHHDHQDWLNV